MSDTNEITIKQFPVDDWKCEEGKREIIARITTEAVDSVGDVMISSGVKKKDFNGLPIYNAHEYMDNPKALPIGTVRWVKYSDAGGKPSLISKGYISDQTDDAKDIFNLTKDGVIRGVSVGFKTLEQHRPSAAELKKYGVGCKNIISSFDLKEWSVAPLQCNEEAITLMVSKGYKQKWIDMAHSPKQEEAVIVHEVTKAIVTNEVTLEEARALMCKRIESSLLHVDADAILKRLFR